MGREPCKLTDVLTDLPLAWIADAARDPSIQGRRNLDTQITRARSREIPDEVLQKTITEAREAADDGP